MGRGQTSQRRISEKPTFALRTHTSTRLYGGIAAKLLESAYPDAMDDTPSIQSGDFASTLDAAIRARGLGLFEGRRRLTRMGTPMSALRSWRVGARRPEHRNSLDALDNLEEILRLDAGDLSARLGPSRRLRRTREDAADDILGTPGCCNHCWRPSVARISRISRSDPLGEGCRGRSLGLRARHGLGGVGAAPPAWSLDRTDRRDRVLLRRHRRLRGRHQLRVHGRAADGTFGGVGALRRRPPPWIERFEEDDTGLASSVVRPTGRSVHHTVQDFGPGILRAPLGLVTRRPPTRGASPALTNAYAACSPCTEARGIRVWWG